MATRRLNKGDFVRAVCSCSYCEENNYIGQIAVVLGEKDIKSDFRIIIAFPHLYGKVEDFAEENLRLLSEEPCLNQSES